MSVFQTIAATTRFQSRVLNVIEERIILPNKTEKNFVMVQHPGAVVIAPIAADGTLYLLRQYRHSIRQSIIEFPAGTLGEGELPHQCAARELIEEIGYQAAKWRQLGVLYPAPGFCNEIQHIFVAEDLTPASAEKDEDEVIEVGRFSLEELDQLVTSGEINDAKTLAVLYRLRAMGIVG